MYMYADKVVLYIKLHI